MTLLLGAALALCTAAPGAAEAAPVDTRSHGVRTLYLVRHGAYEEEDPSDPEVGRHLVSIGRQQARLVGARLAREVAPIDSLQASTMTRARETAEILGVELGLKPELWRDLRECLPPRRDRGPESEAAACEIEDCRLELEAAFARLFRPSPERDQAIVVVAHGNVIRYLVCRALAVDPRAWIGFALTHTGVTAVQVRADGSMKIACVNDTAHLPPELKTQGGTAPIHIPARTPR